MNIQWKYLPPNVMTFLTNVFALLCLYISFQHNDRRAAIFLLVAGALDAADGVVARKLNAQSRFGNIYDSMSDFLAFGIAPAFFLYFTELIHPAIALLYVLAIQLRLAQYSAAPESESPEKYFHGLAAPDAVYVGILLGLIPYSSYNFGFAIAALMAIYPGKLWPKGMRLPKLIIGAACLRSFFTRIPCRRNDMRAD